MNLSNARSLKSQLLAMRSPFSASFATATAFSTVAARRSAVRRTMAGAVALGVAPSARRNDYRLAVRLQRTGREVDALVEDIRGEARGEVDVREIGTITKLAKGPAYFRGRRRPLVIGASIGDRPPAGYVNAGTLGCFVVGRSSPYYLFLLTNNHVIAGENSKPKGSLVVQPGTLDGGKFDQDVVGELGRFIPLKTSGVNRVDAAMAHVYEGVPVDTSTVGDFGSLRGLGSVYRLPSRAKVHKAGRTTAQTTGRVTAFDVDNVHVEYDIGVLRFDGQIEIEGTGKRAFSDSGDSGSLIVDGSMKAVGLLFAGGTTGGVQREGAHLREPDRHRPRRAAGRLGDVKKGASLEVARAAKAPAARAFHDLTGCEVSVGLSRVGEDTYALKVNLTEAPAAGLTLPTEIEGVPVRVEVVGRIRKL